MPHCVENPIEGDPKLTLSPDAGRFHPVKKAFELDAPPVVDDAYRDIHLSMHHTLGRQTLQHAKGDQFVVRRSAQPLADRFERQQEAGEIGVAIKCPGLGKRQPLAVVPRLNSTRVSGDTVPSRCRWSSALGSPRNQVAAIRRRGGIACHERDENSLRLRL